MIHTKEKYYTIYNASCLDVMDSLPENSIDAIVTDPPYEIGFMNKGWDKTGIAFDINTWKKALRVLKPGGHILAFNHSRTFHRMVVAIEDAGFEIRDTIMWLYGSGFPKSHDISKAIDKSMGAEREVVGNKYVKDFSKHKGSMMNKTTTENYETQGTYINTTAPSTKQAKQWQGWGSALKPSYEPITLARKPLKGTLAQNTLKYGVGGINIDECRVETEDDISGVSSKTSIWGDGNSKEVESNGNDNGGRFPANTIHDGSEEVVSAFPKDNDIDDSASRFFYTAKASKKDRDEGLDLDFQTVGDGRKKSIDNAFQRGKTLRKNTHPAVKPTELMQYLARLISPKGATILDPFMGSGSTGKACMIENNERNSDYHFIGIDLEEEYCDIAKARIEYGVNYKENKAKEEEQELVDKGQTSIFDFEGGE